MHDTLIDVLIKEIKQIFKDSTILITENCRVTDTFYVLGKYTLNPNFYRIPYQITYQATLHLLLLMPT